ncbi:MAG: hypothetical protein ACREL7_11645 [Longimicrobiales bacterium]
MPQNLPGAPPRRSQPVTVRGHFTFYLDRTLVERARRDVGEQDVIRSIEAALAAALDYQLWIREVSTGKRDRLA